MQSCKHDVVCLLICVVVVVVIKEFCCSRAAILYGLILRFNLTQMIEFVGLVLRVGPKDWEI